jgi:hypothetical protein
VTDQRGEDVHAQDHERDADDPLHHIVDPLGQLVAQHDGRRADQEDDQGVPERVDRPEHDRVPAIVL